MYVEGNLTAGRLNITGVASDRASDQHVAVGGGAVVGSWWDCAAGCLMVSSMSWKDAKILVSFADDY